jgi:hypothetical protein
MIGGFSSYETTEVKDYGEREKLNLGGHYCKILNAEIEEVVSKKDGQKYNILKLQFDIDAPDEQAGFYQRKYKEAVEKDAMMAKWKGYYRLTIPTNESPDFAKTNWKTFLTSVEKSNPGTKLDGVNGFDEKILLGKVFGGVFGLEEMTLPTDGKLITFTKIRFARSTEKVLEAPIPKVKLLDGTFMDYEKYIEKKDEEKAAESEAEGKTIEESATIGDNDDLPF